MAPSAGRLQARHRSSVPFGARLSFFLGEQIQEADRERVYRQSLFTGGWNRRHGRTQALVELIALSATIEAMERCRTRWFDWAVRDQEAEDMGWYGDVFAREGIPRRTP